MTQEILTNEYCIQNLRNPEDCTLTAINALDMQDLLAAEVYTTNTGDIDNKLVQELNFLCQNRGVYTIKSWKKSHPKRN